MKFLGYKNLSLDEVISPSPWNPRLKGLSPDEPAIQALADSIKKEGQLQPIVVRKLNGKFRVVDGDRRCVAIFKVLKKSTIKAAIYEMSDYEEARVRLVSNIQRQDLSPVEKGKYCCDLFRIISEMSNLDPDDAWNDRLTRSKILSQIANEVDVSLTTIINWIRLWKAYPPEAQKLIATNKEELRQGLVPPHKALKAAYLARYIGEKPEKVLRLAIKHKWSTRDLEAAILRVKRGEEITKQNFVEKIEEYRKNRRRVGPFTVNKANYDKFTKIADIFKLRMDALVDLCIEFCINHHELFSKFILQKLDMEGGFEV